MDTWERKRERELFNYADVVKPLTLTKIETYKGQCLYTFQGRRFNQQLKIYIPLLTPKIGPDCLTKYAKSSVTSSGGTSYIRNQRENIQHGKSLHY